MLIVAALIACTPGTVSTTAGSDRLRTALYHVERDPDGDQLTLMLFNSYVPCQLEPRDGDAQAIDAAREALDIALLREGSRVVFAEVLRLPGEKTWTGPVPIYDDENLGRFLDGVDPMAARALYGGVNEATLLDDDGLEQTYNPTDVDLAWITPPSWLELRETRDGLSGRFSLENVDVAGRFRAQPCPTLDQHVARAYAVLLTATTDGGDTAE